MNADQHVFAPELLSDEVATHSGQSFFFLIDVCGFILVACYYCVYDYCLMANNLNYLLVVLFVFLGMLKAHREEKYSQHLSNEMEDFCSADDSDRSASDYSTSSLSNFVVDSESDAYLAPSSDTAIVTLNSVFHLYKELSSDQCFTRSDVHDVIPFDECYVGCCSTQEGCIPENTMIDRFAQYSYSVERSSVEELCSYNKSRRDSYSTFIVQGVAERTMKELLDVRKSENPRGMKFTSGRNLEIPYMTADDKEELEDHCNCNWKHCVHVMPSLNCFYCTSQRFGKEFVCCPLSWLRLNDSNCGLREGGYLRIIDMIWKISVAKDNCITRLGSKCQINQSKCGLKYFKMCCLTRFFICFRIFFHHYRSVK